MKLPDSLSNRTWDQLKVGDEATLERRVTARDLFLFAHASGNYNHLHLPTADASAERLRETVAPSMWVGSLVSSLLGNILPGPGTLYRAQSFRFLSRAHIDDQIRIHVKLTEKLERPQVRFETTVSLEDGTPIMVGEAEVDAPLETITIPPEEIPDLVLEQYDHFKQLIVAAKKLEAMPTAVVCPDDDKSLGGTLLAMREGLIVPLLIGGRAAIEAQARAIGVSLDGIEIIDLPDHRAASAKAVELVHAHTVRAIMKGNVHSDELLAQVVKREGGLRGARRVSHVFVINVPTLDHPLFITDAAINIAPDLTTKADIIQNAIDLAHACGIERPKVAIMSAVETVNFSIPSSMDAAILAKMAERGQITGGDVDGPLAMDNAIDLGAATTKKIVSSVAGRAQILVVPNLEAGNMVAKQLTFVAHAQPAGLVLGAKVPVMLTSRADSEKARLASCALALLYDNQLRRPSAH